MRTLVALLLLLSTQGCATIFYGTTQSVEITSDPSGAVARIEPDGVQVETPAAVSLPRLYDHTVTFTLAGYHPVSKNLRREASSLTGGNVLVGGLIGVSIDAATGAQYNLVPDPLHVSLIPDTVEATAEAAVSETGAARVVFINTNSWLQSNRVEIELDGKELCSLARFQYFELEVERGIHSLEVGHWDVFMFRDRYELTVNDSPLFVTVFSGTFSTEYAVADHLPDDMDAYEQLRWGSGSDDCQGEAHSEESGEEADYESERLRGIDW